MSYDKFLHDAIEEASRQGFDEAAESYELRNIPDFDPDDDWSPEEVLDDDEEDV